jgi:hypothetical protein
MSDSYLSKSHLKIKKMKIEFNFHVRREVSEPSLGTMTIITALRWKRFLLASTTYPCLLYLERYYVSSSADFSALLAKQTKPFMLFLHCLLLSASPILGRLNKLVVHSSLIYQIMSNFHSLFFVSMMQSLILVFQIIDGLDQSKNTRTHNSLASSRSIVTIKRPSS